MTYQFNVTVEVDEEKTVARPEWIAKQIKEQIEKGIEIGLGESDIPVIKTKVVKKIEDVKASDKEKELEFYQAYNRVIAEVNRGGMVCQKLVKQLNAEHPTLKMCLLRAIVKSLNEVDIRYDGYGKVTWHDGRIGKSVVDFCAKGTVPFI